MLDDFMITDSTTRGNLIARIDDLDEEIQKLKTKIEDKNEEIKDLRLAPKQRERLEEAAEEWVAQGRIHNTPAAKLQWVEGN